MKEQRRNTRQNVFWKINGESKCIADWCIEYNINVGTVASRIKRGWSRETALEIPADKKHAFRK